MSRNTVIRGLLVAGLLVLLVVLLLDDDGGEEGVSAGQPTVVAAEQLSEFAAEADEPVYWLGPREDAEYELSETESGRAFVRYLNEGAVAGDPRPEYVTVGTYPSPDAAAALTRVAVERDDVELARTDDGAVILVGRGSGGRAHLAYPGDDVEVEVFSPVVGEALRLAVAGKVEEVR
jgi:hypothetical protein